MAVRAIALALNREGCGYEDSGSCTYLIFPFTLWYSRQDATQGILYCTESTSLFCCLFIQTNTD
jgi:hypothetical protein